MRQRDSVVAGILVGVGLLLLRARGDDVCPQRQLERDLVLRRRDRRLRQRYARDDLFAFRLRGDVAARRRGHVGGVPG